MRLTQQMRESILSKAMGETNKGFQKRVDTIKKRENAVALKCYNTVFSAAIRAKVNALPDEWFGTDECLRFNVNGMDIRLMADKKYRVPSRAAYGCNRLGTITGEMAEEVMAVVNDKEKLKEEHAQVRAKLSALLENCMTLKILETTWPEGKPFYDYLVKADKEQKAGLPAVLISDINKALGLAAA